jgi:hypothetical protein
MNTEKWMKSGAYLPPPMRDFHDQKDLFKAIHETIRVDDLTWVKAHCYVVDVFLWYMARRGYTLQRTKRKGEYRSLDADVAACNERRTAAFIDVLQIK